MNQHPPFTTERFSPRSLDDERSTPTALQFIKPSMLAGAAVPVRSWIVPEWIPKNVVTGLYGDGGLGKSLIAMQLQTAAALGKTWLCLPTEPCASLGVYCEDGEDELHRRQADINASYGCDFDDLGDATWLPRLGEENLLMTFARNGVGEVTNFYKQVLTAARDLGAKLIIADTAADLFGGNENDRGQVRQFMGSALGRLAQKINGAVVLCAHPSRSGLASGQGDSGSTGWSNALRSRLFLRAPDSEDGVPADPDARILQCKKANYAARNDELKLLWSRGCINPEIQSASTLSMKRSVEDVFLSILDEFTATGRNVSSNAYSRNYAPRLFAKVPKDSRDGYGVRDLERALNKLFDARKITNIEFGPRSKLREKIARVSQP